MMYEDLQVGHLSTSFSPLNPQFPQIGILITGLNESTTPHAFSIIFLIWITLVPSGIFNDTNKPPLRILVILLHSIISALFGVSYVIVLASNIIPFE